MKGEDIQIIMDRYLAGTASEEEIKFVEALIAHQQEKSPTFNPTEQEERVQFEIIMQKLDQVEQSNQIEKDFIHNRMKERRIYRNLWYSAAACLLFLLLAGIFRYYFEGNVTLKKEIVYTIFKAPLGGPTYIRLSDSSEVWLNEGTTFRYPKQFNGLVRNVEILNGEAFFQVHHEEGNPFIVRTGQILTRDIGTSFNIKSYLKGRSTIVSVVTGKVSVQANQGLPKGDSILLTPSQQMRYDSKTQKMKLYKFKEGDLRSWQKGAYSYQEETIGDILEELKSRFHVKIKLKHAQLANLMVTADFPKGTKIESILKILFEINQNKVKRITANEFLIQ